MASVMVIGGGLAGCTAALELARRGYDVIIIEKSGIIGGKVREYGCKATDICHQCGLCLTRANARGAHGDTLWNQVETHERIKIFSESHVLDIFGALGDYQVIIKQKNRTETITGLTAIVVSIGFEPFSARSFSSLEFQAADTIITGSRLEKLLKERNKEHLLPSVPSSIGFIQCYGSRDCREQAGYCSRVCCGYSTRAARVLRRYYPEAQISFFYMDLQQIEIRDTFPSLQQEGIEFIRCRPVKITSGSPPAIVYERPDSGEIMARNFDWVILSEGVHPARDTARAAEVFGLGLTGEGFLKYVKDPRESGVYLTGCAGGPKPIGEVYAESLRIAREISGGRR